MTDVLSEVHPSRDALSDPLDHVEVAETPTPSPGPPDTSTAASARTRATKKRAPMARLRTTPQPAIPRSRPHTRAACKNIPSRTLQTTSRKATQGKKKLRTGAATNEEAHVAISSCVILLHPILATSNRRKA
ncbi:hypothetical protein MTO96_028744 [Rhipicephalus appendiculatus]